MRRVISIGEQDYVRIKEQNAFVVDKTDFIREWWDSTNQVTLITRPRRFGKTFNMSMLNSFFSLEYAGRSDLFADMKIWQSSEYRALQGTYPVITLTFSSVKSATFDGCRHLINETLARLYTGYRAIIYDSLISEEERRQYDSVSTNMSPETAVSSLHNLCLYLSRCYGKKPIILLDEYDTPMQEAWMSGYWDELVGFFRGFFNNTFKDNPYLERSVMTGVTRVSKESIFSDLNNLKVVTTTSDLYATSFGFTESEVFAALDEFGLSDKKATVKEWYDGFTFGQHTDIYNPWSITSYLDEKREIPYWANTSSNSLVGRLIAKGDNNLKRDVEELLKGGTIHVAIDEQIVFNQLGDSNCSVWSLFLASGYLKVLRAKFNDSLSLYEYDLTLTNREVKVALQKLIGEWFTRSDSEYSEFQKSLICGDIEAMNYYMNDVVMSSFSYFDTGSGLSEAKMSERFYHGFVLGLLVNLRAQYDLRSNRESGMGRYDVMLEPKGHCSDLPAIIIEFKVFNPQKEKDMTETVANALSQIEDKQYASELLTKGYTPENIKKYGFAFYGKKVLIG